MEWIRAEWETNFWSILEELLVTSKETDSEVKVEEMKYMFMSSE